jgi:hypothetical protein
VDKLGLSRISRAAFHCILPPADDAIFRHGIFAVGLMRAPEVASLLISSYALISAPPGGCFLCPRKMAAGVDDWRGHALDFSPAHFIFPGHPAFTRWRYAEKTIIKMALWIGV